MSSSVEPLLRSFPSFLPFPTRVHHSFPSLSTSRPIGPSSSHPQRSSPHHPASQYPATRATSLAHPSLAANSLLRHGKVSAHVATAYRLLPAKVIPHPLDRQLPRRRPAPPILLKVTATTSQTSLRKPRSLLLGKVKPLLLIVLFYFTFPPQNLDASPDLSHAIHRLHLRICLGETTTRRLHDRSRSQERDERNNRPRDM